MSTFQAEPWHSPAAPIDGGGNLRSIERFEGLRVTVLEGNGKDDPYRNVVHYFDERGQRIGVADPTPPESKDRLEIKAKAA